MSDVVLKLPDALRADLKEPMGRLYTDSAALLADAGDPLVAVGDIVTYHLLEAGRVPDVALVDERTKRSAVDAAVSAAIEGFDRRVSVSNPAATLTRALLVAMRDALDGDGTTLVDVDGEEDLAALPAVLAIPDGGSVVYGQPDEGMVLVMPDDATRERVRSLLDRMDGDTEAALEAIR
ncbi:GTP-dependent dephospho-CoA kinase family protein [Halomicroarcula sp. S1AR25-4]|uniref:GTP-dependent dephospho-CoA kinase family protein n=1 Tax=Haloarcula sp. S1AR25-4 TaxID=2950538 RepID=UPI002875B33C|nr:GTP-dependent dephospho-CoA kinase family protein [Halomicroarcula sp. S1AR25-4]MDS0278852.1 GTP-dependent dephospho-CoA kinase family protein [Halomicroarcula sp. S1AR25-4]